MKRIEIPADAVEALRRATAQMNQMPPGLAGEIARISERAREQAIALQNAHVGSILERLPNYERPYGAHVASIVDQLAKHERLYNTHVGSILNNLPKFDERWHRQMSEMVRRMAEQWEEAMPPNWDGQSPSEILDIVERVEETGFCLVWLPWAELVHQVLAADPAGAEALLLGRRDDVLDDCVAVLAEVVEPEHQLERDAARKAILAFRDGHGEAAQALACSVFTSTLHRHFGAGTNQSRRLMEVTHPRDATVDKGRLTTIYLAGARALSQFGPDTAQPVCTTFNRHNTAHRITAEQWTDGNALRAIMLATALLREVDWWLERRHRKEAA